MVDIIGVRFRSAGKVYYFALKDFELRIGDHVIVETARGPEYGVVATRARTVSDDMWHSLCVLSSARQRRMMRQRGSSLLPGKRNLCASAERRSISIIWR